MYDLPQIDVRSTILGGPRSNKSSVNVVNEPQGEKDVISVFLCFSDEEKNLDEALDEEKEKERNLRVRKI